MSRSSKSTKSQEGPQEPPIDQPAGQKHRTRDLCLKRAVPQDLGHFRQKGSKPTKLQDIKLCRSCLVQETPTCLVASTVSAMCRHRKQKSFFLYQQKPWPVACTWLWSWPVSFTKMVPVLLPGLATLPSFWDLYTTGKNTLRPQTSHAFLVEMKPMRTSLKSVVYTPGPSKTQPWAFYKDTLQPKTTTEGWNPVVQSHQITQVTIILIPDFTEKLKPREVR